MERLCCSAEDRRSSSDSSNVRHYIGPHFKHRGPAQKDGSEDTDTPKTSRKLVQKLKSRFSRDQPLLSHKFSRSEGISVHRTEDPVDLDLTGLRSVSQGGYDSDAHILSLSSVLRRLPRISIASNSRPWLPPTDIESPLLSATDKIEASQNTEDSHKANCTGSISGHDHAVSIHPTTFLATNGDGDINHEVLENIGAPNGSLRGGDVLNRPGIIDGGRSKSSEASVHLYDMRISQHLRSLSSMSGDSMGPLGLDPSHSLTVSDITNVGQQKASDASFQSLKVPPTWGRVVPLRLLSSHDGPSDELTPSIVSRASRRSVSMNYDEAAAAWEKAARKASISNFSLKPLDTQHSFDRLTIPSRKGSEPSSPSSPVTRQELPAITVTSAVEPRERYTPSSLVAWSRYPSHTRKERTGSAGILDDVLVHDFEAPSIITDDSARGSRDLERLKKKRRAKARSLIFKKKLFLDLPRLFKSRSLGFHKGERGHRSSIGPGGLLEYPELELLPASEPRLPSTSILASPLPSPVTSESSTIEFRSAPSSSRYDSNTSRVVFSSGYDNTNLLSASDWAAVYGGCVQRRSTEFVSPLDDGNTGRERIIINDDEEEDIPRPRSTGARSLPTSPGERKFLHHDTVRSVSSMQRMRRSTRDLFETLEADEERGKDEALKAAEVAWQEEP